MYILLWHFPIISALILDILILSHVQVNFDELWCYNPDKHICLQLFNVRDNFRWAKYRGDWLHPSHTKHYSDVIMSAMMSQITGISIVYSIVCPGADERKRQSSPSLAFVKRIHRWIPRTKGQWRGKCFHLMSHPELRCFHWPKHYLSLVIISLFGFWVKI